MSLDPAFAQNQAISQDDARLVLHADRVTSSSASGNFAYSTGPAFVTSARLCAGARSDSSAGLGTARTAATDVVVAGTGADGLLRELRRWRRPASATLPEAGGALRRPLRHRETQPLVRLHLRAVS